VGLFRESKQKEKNARVWQEFLEQHSKDASRWHLNRARSLQLIALRILFHFAIPIVPGGCIRQISNACSWPLPLRILNCEPFTGANAGLTQRSAPLFEQNAFIGRDAYVRSCGLSKSKRQSPNSRRRCCIPYHLCGLSERNKPTFKHLYHLLPPSAPDSVAAPQL
jgi:hypothetical protein